MNSLDSLNYLQSSLAHLRDASTSLNSVLSVSCDGWDDGQFESVNVNMSPIASQSRKIYSDAAPIITSLRKFQSLLREY
ncbi:MAG: hypothetical protein ACOYJL_08110 [Tractidigestivibacter sp.]|jgi:hypothetical protein|uniref:hypothetical protein n=1 Tax=Tractidigestivibacter sp. TaxID=2847320 RepID=UPI003D9072C7